MRTIIAGSRGLGYSEVCAAMRECGWTPSIVLSGTARGVDRAGEQWAAENNIPIERYPADWEKEGKRAGYLRNASMVAKAQALVGVWDGWSKGTEHVIQCAKDAGLKVFVWRIDERCP